MQVTRILIYWDNTPGCAGWAYAVDVDGESNCSGGLGSPGRRNRTLRSLRRQLRRECPTNALLYDYLTVAREREFIALEHDGPGWEWKG